MIGKSSSEELDTPEMKELYEPSVAYSPQYSIAYIFWSANAQGYFYRA